jgi:hypothetical protein
MGDAITNTAREGRGEHNTMRTTNELIAELEEESSQHWYVAIAVAFEHSTVIVSSTDGDRLKKLNDAVNAGGHPIGLIAAEQSDGRLSIMTTIYPENADMEEQCHAILDQLKVSAGQLLATKISRQGRRDAEKNACDMGEA